MNTKKLLALILVLALVLCALPMAYAADPAIGEDTDIEVDVEDLPDVSVLYGDADGNGELTIFDSMLIQQYLAGWDVTVDAAAADADGNGDAVSPLPPKAR